MLGVAKMKTVKGIGVGEEAVIGELSRYKSGAQLGTVKARIALLLAEECDFDTLFEVSQEFMGFVCLGEYDKNIAEIAEELRLVGIFSDDEGKLFDSISEKAIILPRKSKALLSPDVKALESFGADAFAWDSANDERERELVFCGSRKNIKRKIKKYF